MPPDLNHLSYSSISSYLLCGHAWRLHYIDKVQTPTAPALVMGSAWHDAVEQHLRSGADLGAAWSTAWGTQLERNPEIAWGDDTPTMCAETGERMTAAKPVKDMLAEIRANFDPERGALERRVELRVPGVPIPVIGYVDVITRDGIPGDFKTAARMWSDGKAEDDLQSLFYLAALNQAGDPTPRWAFRHYVVTKAAKPMAKVFEVEHTPGQMFWLFEVIQSVWQAIDAEVYPKNPSSWKCSPKWCDYWQQCRGRYG
jgi:CRISPR/Cas system-associated exonuclease Cas4 (RecB family)